MEGDRACIIRRWTAAMASTASVFASMAVFSAFSTLCRMPTSAPVFGYVHGTPTAGYTIVADNSMRLCQYSCGQQTFYKLKLNERFKDVLDVWAAGALTVSGVRFPPPLDGPAPDCLVGALTSLCVAPAVP